MYMYINCTWGSCMYVCMYVCMYNVHAEFHIKYNYVCLLYMYTYNIKWVRDTNNTVQGLALSLLQ